MLEKSIIPRLAVGLAVAVIALLTIGHPANGQSASHSVYLPAVFASCQAIPGVSYGRLPIVGSPVSPPPAANPDINLNFRGWQATNAPHQLVTYNNNNNGSPDALAPQLWGLFTDNRVPTISEVDQVFDWNWGADQRGGPIATWPVTLAGFQVQPGEIIQTPPSGRDIGQGFRALVLYATSQQITLKYTGEDNVIFGYTIHIENICVNPGLVALFQALSGGSELPALNSYQPIGRAIGAEIDVAIRDAGSFMDPRSHNDWWQGK